MIDNYLFSSISWQERPAKGIGTNESSDLMLEQSGLNLCSERHKWVLLLYQHSHCQFTTRDDVNGRCHQVRIRTSGSRRRTAGRELSAGWASVVESRVARVGRLRPTPTPERRTAATRWRRPKCDARPRPASLSCRWTCSPSGTVGTSRRSAIANRRENVHTIPSLLLWRFV